jgi:hypothetical protein
MTLFPNTVHAFVVGAADVMRRIVKISSLSSGSSGLIHCGHRDHISDGVADFDGIAVATARTRTIADQAHHICAAQAMLRQISTQRHFCKESVFHGSTSCLILTVGG